MLPHLSTPQCLPCNQAYSLCLPKSVIAKSDFRYVWKSVATCIQGAAKECLERVNYDTHSRRDGISPQSPPRGLLISIRRLEVNVGSVE